MHARFCFTLSALEGLSGDKPFWSARARPPRPMGGTGSGTDGRQKAPRFLQEGTTTGRACLAAICGGRRRAVPRAPAGPSMPQLNVLCCAEFASTLLRGCVDCGRLTGSFCDGCHAADRLPMDHWALGQRTPLCTSCDRLHDACHYCRGVQWCTPPMHSRG